MQSIRLAQLSSIYMIRRHCLSRLRSLIHHLYDTYETRISFTGAAYELTVGRMPPRNPMVQAASQPQLVSRTLHTANFRTEPPYKKLRSLIHLWQEHSKLCISHSNNDNECQRPTYAGGEAA